MGELANPTPEEREQRLRLADEIVDAVREDECGPCDVPFEFRRSRSNANALSDAEWKRFEEWCAENEQRCFDLAHEVLLLKTERFDLRAALNEACDEWEGCDQQVHSERGSGPYMAPERIAELREQDIPIGVAWVMVWKDRHTDDGISVHLSLGAARASLRDMMAEYDNDRDRIGPDGWDVEVKGEFDVREAVLSGAKAFWSDTVRARSDGPRGHIELATVQR